MKNILHIISSPMEGCSHSIRLGRAIIKQLLLKYPGSSINERSLINDTPPFLTGLHISAFFKKPDERSDEEKEELGYSDLILQEMNNADIIILGAPMYNFAIHASLKAFIDQVIRIGQTFKYQEDGTRIGILLDKTVYLAITAGASYSNEEPNPIDRYITGYLVRILNFIGIDKVVPIIIEGTAKPQFRIDYDEICRHI